MDEGELVGPFWQLRSFVFCFPLGPLSVWCLGEVTIVGTCVPTYLPSQVGTVPERWVLVHDKEDGL